MARVVRRNHGAKARVEVCDAQGQLVRSWEEDTPGGGTVIGEPVWVDDRWLALETRAGTLSSGVSYTNVVDGRRLGVTWVETRRSATTGADLPLYADVTFWILEKEGWLRQPVLLLRDRPVYPVIFPDGERFAGWQITSPSFARMLFRAVERYRKQRAAGEIRHDLVWVSRSWVEPAPRGTRAAVCVNRADTDNAAVLLLDLRHSDPADVVRSASLLPTNIPSEYENISVAWVSTNRLRIDATLPGTAAPLSHTLYLPD